MPLDAEGIWQYTGPELAAPAPALLNRGMGSTSTQVKALRAKTVRTYASAAARTAALPAPAEGALTWLEDLDRLEVWTGAKWLPMVRGQTVAVNGPLDPSGLITVNHSLGVVPTGASFMTTSGTADDINGLIGAVVVWGRTTTTVSLRVIRSDSHSWFTTVPNIVGLLNVFA